MNEVDIGHLALAVALAGGDEALTSPNPTVGCVLVGADGAVVGRGRTEPPGGRHAEVVALAEAGPAAVGATAYVTLEPCDHHGRTGPCSAALRDAGVARVVVPSRDPVDAHSGGVETLRAGGVTVELVRDGGWSSAATPRFLRRARTGLPWVTLKLAHRLDGSTVVTDGGWITGADARRRVHAQRARHDAVLVGIGTVLTDDPRLDVRHVPHRGVQPRPVVVDSDARTPPDAAVVQRRAVVVVGQGAPHHRTAVLRDAGATVVAVPRSPAGRVQLEAALTACHELGLEDLYAEPGDTLSAALVAADLVGECVLHHPVGTVTRRPAAWHAGSWTASAATRLGDDVEERWRPRGGVDELVTAVRRWATGVPTVRGVALVGSHARGTAGQTSDVDLVLLVDDPRPWLEADEWLSVLGDVVSVDQEEWGAVTSRRVALADGTEVELGLTSPTWAAVPLDEGTARVLRAGVRIVHDRAGLLRRAVASLE